jgi:hypothetical protein
MSDKIEYSRLILKRSDVSGVTPTVTSATTLNQFTETDLFSGEMFLNTVDERAFVRMNNNILEFDLVSSGGTDYNFCDTGIQTSAISGCSPVEIYDDLTFQSQKNITSSNGVGKIELDFEGNTNTTRIGSSGATFNDYLQIDPDFNFNGTELTSTDGTTDNFSSVFVQPNYTEMSSTSDNVNYYSNISTQIVSGKFGDTAELGLGVEDNVANTSANISLTTNFGGLGQIDLSASDHVRISNPSLLFDTDASIQTQFPSQTCDIFTTTSTNQINIGSSDSTVTISGNTHFNSGISFDSGNNNWVYVELEIGDWDMDTNATTTVAHSLSSTEWKTVRNYQAIVRRDDDTQYYGLYTQIGAQGVSSWGATQFNLERDNAGEFDNANFSSTGYNRGWIGYWYQPD